MSAILQMVYRFREIPIRIQMYWGGGYAIIHIDSQKFQISKTYLEHKEQV